MKKPKINELVLVDCMSPVEDLHDLPRVTILSEQQLREELNRFRQRRPSVVQLIGADGEILEMGIGENLSGMKWIHPPLGDHLKIAVANPLASSRGMEFRFQGTDSGTRPKYLLPVEQAIEAAVHFFKTHQLPEWIQWSEWNPRIRRMGTTPVNKARTGFLGKKGAS